MRHHLENCMIYAVDSDAHYVRISFTTLDMTKNKEGF